MYYTVVFEDANVVGTVKRDWLLNEKECKYPPIKQVNKNLKLNVKCETSEWDVYKIVLKNPKHFGEPGVETLKQAKDMEKHYSIYSDTDDYQDKIAHQQFLKLHPTMKIQKTNFNEFVPKEVKESAAVQHSQSAEYINENKNEYQEVIETETHPENEENYSEQFYEVEYVNEDIGTGTEEHLDVDSYSNGIKDDSNIQTARDSQIMNICQEILKNISAINDKISSMDKRLNTLELHILRKVNLDGFKIDKIKNLQEFEEFLKKVGDDEEFRQKLIYFLFLNCVKGRAKYRHNGVTNKIVTKLFTKKFINILGWSTEKQSTSDLSQDKRVHLCEYKTFQNICLEVLNYDNPVPRHLSDHVGSGLREFFKRLTRTKAAV